MKYNEIDINDRLKIVRETLGLSQAAFGEKLCVDRAAVSLMERKQRNVTDRSIKDICREFNVDYIWLTTGDGEMFVDSDDDVFELIDRIMLGENEFHKNLFKTFARLDESELAALESVLDKFIDIKKGDR